MIKELLGSELLEPGMVTAEELNLNGHLLCVPEGTVLNPYLIKRIKDNEIEKVNIVRKTQDDAVPCLGLDIIDKWLPSLVLLFKHIYKNQGSVGDIEKAIMCALCGLCVPEIYEYLMSVKDKKVYIPICTKENTYTEHHSIVVGALCGLISMSLGDSKDSVLQAITAGMLHDVGKGFISNDIIYKPSKLTEDEFKIIKMHPTFGHKYLQLFPQTNNVRIIEAVLLHHERLDGRGYPHGIKSVNIPILAQIVAVADCCDAICNKRSYSNTTDVFDMSNELLKSEDVSPFIVNKLVQKLNSYYDGLGVYLSNGETGYVISTNHDNNSRPVVHIVSPEEKDVDLSSSKYASVDIVDTFTRLYTQVRCL